MNILREWNLSLSQLFPENLSTGVGPTAHRIAFGNKNAVTSV
jgi:hypothetical protein